MGINYRLDRRKSLGNFPSAQQFHGVDNADKSLQKKAYSTKRQTKCRGQFFKDMR